PRRIAPRAPGSGHLLVTCWASRRGATRPAPFAHHFRLRSAPAPPSVMSCDATRRGASAGVQPPRPQLDRRAGAGPRRLGSLYRGGERHRLVALDQAPPSEDVAAGGRSVRSAPCSIDNSPSRPACNDCTRPSSGVSILPGCLDSVRHTRGTDERWIL